MGNKKTVTIKQVKDVYRNLKDEPCPATEKLIKAGYQQLRGGYIKTAKEYTEEHGAENKDWEIDYTKARPTQYWHLFKSYFEEDKDIDDRKIKEDNPFPKSIVCGELLFWMAEVLKCVEKEKLEDLCKKITKKPIPCEKKKKYYEKGPHKGQIIYCRAKWNKEIHDLCFEKIVEKVEKEYAKMQEE